VPVSGPTDPMQLGQSFEAKQQWNWLSASRLTFHGLVQIEEINNEEHNGPGFVSKPPGNTRAR
jgi:hypothetical protein